MGSIPTGGVKLGEGLRRDDSWPIGSTKVFAVIGDPIDHSLSPVLLNAAFTAEGLNAVYVAFRVARDSLGNAMAGMRSIGIAGLSVTMPHKESIIGQLDRVTPRAEALKSVNCVYWDNGEMVGDSTDGPALVASLEEEIGESVGTKSVVVLGTGGAARAIVLALSDAGAGEVVVVGRSEEAVATTVSLASSVARPGTLHEAGKADIVINATNVGMTGTAGEARSPLEAELLSSGQFVYDIIYHPLTTPLMNEARRAGASTSNGIGMLVHQAAKAFTVWTGLEAPLQAMFEAVRKHIG